MLIFVTEVYILPAMKKPLPLETSAAGRKVLERLIQVGPFLPASLTVTRTRCGNPRCRCAREGAIHETALLTWKEDGKTRTRHVPVELRGEVAQWIAEWRKLKNLIERMARPNGSSCRPAK
ncbi:MAG: hypothetical protein E4H44_02990 [Candidatus Aminicenantes bacterium]|nr:MAG: hypothetical protein E4H44_02990 [Candidatus Aminicenantes bacterium]